MVRQHFFYKRSKLTTTYKMLILMAANMWSLSEPLNIMAANISGFTVIYYDTSQELLATDAG